MADPARTFVLLAGWTTVIAALDQGIKQLVVATLSDRPLPLVDGVFSLVYVKNTGVAFGLLHRSGMPVLLVLTVLVLGCFLFLVRPYLPRRAGRAAAALVLGGAVGNMIDRAVHHHVIDYLAVRGWPAFNLADACVVAGVALLLLHLLREERAGATAARREADTP